MLGVGHKEVNKTNSSPQGTHGLMVDRLKGKLVYHESESKDTSRHLYKTKRRKQFFHSGEGEATEKGGHLCMVLKDLWNSTWCWEALQAGGSLSKGKETCPHTV